MDMAALRCTSCHDPHVQAKGRVGLLLPAAHIPFLRGDCASCHTVKGASATVARVPELCFKCHETERPKFAKKYQHAPVNSPEKCLACHGPHGGAGEPSVVRKGDALCLGCHDRKLFEGAVRHQALDQGCVTCHDSHSSDQPKLLKEATTRLCMNCHPDMSKHFHKYESSKPDPRTGRPLSCTSCHDPHAAPLPQLMNYDPKRALCIQCHDPSMAPPPGR